MLSYWDYPGVMLVLVTLFVDTPYAFVYTPFYALCIMMLLRL